MQVKDIIDILKCQVLIEGDLEQEVKTACGSDMMSDVLAFVKDQSVLLTGLMNPQVVRTAEMMDMHCITVDSLHHLCAGQACKPAGAGPGGDEGHDRALYPLPDVYRLRAAV